MQKKIDLLLSFLRCALWNESTNTELDDKEFRSLMIIAEQQSVVGLVIDAATRIKCNIPQRLLYEAISISLNIQHQNQLTNQSLKELVLFCNDNKIEYIIVKGQTIGNLYINPLLRIPGDIDYLISEEYSYIRRKIENSFKIVLPNTLQKKEIAYEKSGITFELHTSLLDFGSKKNELYWESLMHEAWANQYVTTLDDVKVRILPPTINAVYVFLHLFFHLVREGVSLRQFCDWAILLHSYRNEIDKDRVYEILSSLDMLKAYRVFGFILIDEIGLKEAEFPLSLTSDDWKWKGSILNDIFKGGNFGILNHKSSSGFKHRMETLWMLIKNTYRYWSLSPREMKRMIWKVVKIDFLVVVSHIVPLSRSNTTRC